MRSCVINQRTYNRSHVYTVPHFRFGNLISTYIRMCMCPVNNTVVSHVNGRPTWPIPLSNRGSIKALCFAFILGHFYKCDTLYMAGNVRRHIHWFSHNQHMNMQLDSSFIESIIEIPSSCSFINSKIFFCSQNKFLYQFKDHI